ncbi:MAG TPA: VWA domain-containing protein [Chthoniobacteraceae bacterium]|jgi:Ca-activated chloride channel family protein|nr:VWA domain-containing protein [Chthoniobacteraceae bacterium]
MTFGAPHWLEALLLAPALLALFIRNEMLRDDLLKKLVAARLLPNLAASASAVRRRWKYLLALLGLTFVIIALAQPRIGYNVVINHRLGLDLMLAVDTSKSMLSTDVQPDRLTRAKFAAQDLIDSLEGDRVGLIAFAGTSFVEAPLTVDYSAVVNSINALDTNTIPRGGTNIASAIREAADAFGTGEGKSRALVLFTDGEELEDDAVQAAKEVAGKFEIFTVGVGTREGSLIPVPSDGGGTQFLKDDQGQYVKSKLDEEKLKQIAAATGGFYIHLESGPATAKAIMNQGLNKLQEHEFETRESMPIERYQWPLGAGILLLIISIFIRERRPAARTAPRRAPEREAVKVAATVSLLLLMATVHGWSKNEGLNLYDQKNYKEAYDTFQNQLERDPDSGGLEFDSGASAYKEGDYDKALEDFGKVLGSKDQALHEQAEYNLANTLVQRGALQQEKDQKIKEWNDALNHYDQALKANPQNTDAKYNRDLVKRMIDDLNKKEQQQQQQNQQQQNQQQKNQQQNQQQNNQKNQQQNNQKNQQNQNQQNQNQQNQQQQQQQSQQNQQQQNQQQNGQGQQNQQKQQNGQSGQQQQQPQTGQQQKQQQGGGQQNQQAQNQPKQGQGQQNQQKQQGQNPQKQQGQQQNQQAGNQPQQGGQGGPQNPQKQSGQQGQENQASANQNKSMNGASPSPSPGNGQNPQQAQQAEAKAAARGATEAGRPGEMTPSQAKALIDSLRGEEQHVSFEDKHDDNQPVYKDW